jgi:hypothetical protein
MYGMRKPDGKAIKKARIAPRLLHSKNILEVY